MKFSSILTEASAAIVPLIIPVAFVTVMTIIAVTIVMLARIRMSFGREMTGILGIFYEIGAGGAIRLACSWTKMLLLILFLVMFEELSAVEYIIFLVPGVMGTFFSSDIRRLPARLFWFVMEFLGLVTAQIIGAYIRDMRPSKVFLIIYIAISVFLGLLSIYLFFMELGEISAERRPHVNPTAAEEKKNGRKDG